MLTASKDCNLDWKVQYTQYHNISEDDIDVLFRSNGSSIQKYECIDIHFKTFFNQSFFIRIYVISIIEMYKII